MFSRFTVQVCFYLRPLLFVRLPRLVTFPFCETRHERSPIVTSTRSGLEPLYTDCRSFAHSLLASRPLCRIMAFAFVGTAFDIRVLS